MTVNQNRGLWQKMRTAILGVALFAAVAILGVAAWSLTSNAGSADKAYVLYTVSKGDLPIVITERGSLEAQQETRIRNKVETLDSRNRNGTQIIFIVPNGSFAKGPPPPEFALKLDGQTLTAFSVSGADNPESEVERFKIPITSNLKITPDSGEQFGTDVVIELDQGRMVQPLRDKFAALDAKFPERPFIKTVEPGKHWTASQPGDLLIELDSATIRSMIEEQEVDVQQAISRRIQAEAKYNNQIIQNETLLAEATLKVKLAELELKKFRDPVKGDHQLELEKIQRDIDDQNNKILESRTALELQDNEQRAYTELFKRGYKGKGDLDRARSAFLSAESGLVASMNRLETLQASLDSLKEYDREMKDLTLAGAVETATRAKMQVENDNVSLLQQALAAKEEAVKTAEKEQDRLARLKRQLDYCKIYAPHDGMVVYARERDGKTYVDEGQTVRERQSLVTLPDLSRMQVNTQVHEGVLDQVRPGLPVTVRLDAFPDTVFTALVHEVAVVPDSNWGSSVKTYQTIIRINDEVNGLKPGMTAVCEIHVDRIKDVLTIPVQAVVQIEHDNWCYVATGHGVERRMIELGRSNDKFVLIKKGLAVGEKVVLNPSSILEDREELGNDISPEKDEPELSKEAAAVAREHDAQKPKNAKPKNADTKKAGGNAASKAAERLKKMTPEQRKQFIEAMQKKRQAGSQN